MKHEQNKIFIKLTTVLALLAVTLSGCTATRSLVAVDTHSAVIDPPPPQHQTRKTEAGAGVQVQGTSIQVSVTSGNECREVTFQRTEHKTLYRNELDASGRKTQNARFWGGLLLAASGGITFAITCDSMEDPSQCDEDSLNTGKAVAGTMLIGTGAVALTAWAITKAKKGKTEVETTHKDEQTEGSWASCGSSHGEPGITIAATFKVPKKYGNGHQWAKRWGEVVGATDMAGNATLDLSSALVLNTQTLQEAWPTMVEISTKTSDGRYQHIASISTSQIPGLAVAQKKHAAAIAKEQARQKRETAKLWAMWMRMGQAQEDAKQRYLRCRSSCLRSSVSATWAACHARCQ